MSGKDLLLVTRSDLFVVNEQTIFVVFNANFNFKNRLNQFFVEYEINFMVYFY